MRCATCPSDRSLRVIISGYSSARRGFTITELLVVLTIIAIVAGLATPALSTFRTVSLSAEGSRISSLADFARQNSISNDTMSAMVLASSPSGGDHNKAFAVFQLTPKNDGTPYTSADWKQVTKWQILQTGVIADTVTLPDQTAQPPVPFPAFTYNGGAVPSYQYALFTSTGSMLNAKTTSLRLVEGIWPAGASQPTYTHPGSGGSPVNYFQIYFLPSTGLHKIERP